MVKTTKGGKVMNPTDAYRKDLRKKELKRNKKERKKVREVGILKKDPEQLRDQIQKLEMMKAEGALDKARKHKKRQLEDTLNVVLKKRREYEDKMKEKGETPVMFSHLGPPRRLTGAEEDDRAKPPKPEDSVYYHPTLNPTGAPPPGKLPMYKSSIGLRDSLSEASSSAGAGSSSAITELDDATLPVPPPPPLPPSLPNSDDLDAVEASVIPESLPLPPPPPMPPKPQGLDPSLPILPPPPPPPPGPPPKEHLALRPPPPPGLNQLAQPPPPGTGGANVENNRSVGPDGFTSKDQIQVPTMLPPPPPPSESNAKIHLDNKDIQQMVPPPPPPPRQPASVPVLGVLPTLQPDILPPGISRLPPPPPMPDMYPPIPGAALPPGMLPYMPRPPFGPPPMMRPPLPPGPPPFLQADDFRPPTVQKPSYVKSAAPTVVKRPLAQHTPELTSMVPASVRVRRESALTKPKPKSSSSATTIMKQSITPTVVKQGSSTTSSSAPKPPSIDDSYMAFLEDMKELGALDS